ncbi:unannotated protein [freshwater metagenome]|uniref:Unannotated protein n=1 Tax=freshwater metagenome TaxID=449393 RepID=A0A6J7EBK5_9ZZZZ
MVQTQLLVDLVATNFGCVITLLVEVEIINKVLCGLKCGRFAWTQLAVNIQQSIFLLRPVAVSLDVILFKGQAD